MALGSSMFCTTLVVSQGKYGKASLKGAALSGHIVWIFVHSNCRIERDSLLYIQRHYQRRIQNIVIHLI